MSEDLDCIYLSQYMEYWRTIVKRVMRQLVPYVARNTVDRLFDFRLLKTVFEISNIYSWPIGFRHVRRQTW